MLAATRVCIRTISWSAAVMHVKWPVASVTWHAPCLNGTSYRGVLGVGNIWEYIYVGFGTIYRPNSELGKLVGMKHKNTTLAASSVVYSHVHMYGCDRNKSTGYTLTKSTRTYTKSLASM